MGCCGGGPRDTARRTAAPEGSSAEGRATVRVRFLRRREALVYGPSTGHVYRFSGAGDVQEVYAADVPHIMRAGLVERV